jgi:hypothetical protein
MLKQVSSLRVIQISSCSILLADYKTFHLEINDPCYSPAIDQNGTCMHLNNCKMIKQVKGLQICSFQGRVPIICCPEINNLTNQKLKAGTGLMRTSETSKKFGFLLILIHLKMSSLRL